MPPPPPPPASKSHSHYHPQTSRQAKKAYLKKQRAGGTNSAASCLSEIDQRRLNRDVELYERAQRIRAKEERRKTNLRKRQEKVEKEKKARREKGLLGDGRGVENEKIKISPRQKRLGGFVVGLGKQLRRVDGGIQEEGNDNTTTAEEEEGDEVDEEEEEEERIQTAATAVVRSPLQAKSSNAVVQSCMVAASYARREIDLGGDDDLPLDNRNIKQRLSPSVSAITPTKARQESCFIIETITAVEVENTAELLGLISTQDLQSSDDDCSSTSGAVLGDSKDHHGGIVEDKRDENDDGASDPNDNDFADADFEELAQDFEFGPSPLMSDSRQVRDPKEKVSVADAALHNDKRILNMLHIPSQTERKKEIENDDSLFDKFAPSSQDLLDLDATNEFDIFEISTQDIRILDPP